MHDGGRMIGPALQNTLNTAFAKTIELGHEYVTLEHLLYALIQDADVKKALISCSVDFEALHQDIEKHFETLAQVNTSFKDGKVPTTTAVQRVIQRAAFDVQAAGKNEIMPCNVLIALFNEKDSFAVYFLQKQDVTRLDLVTFISHGISKLPEKSSDEMSGDGKISPEGKESSGFLINLNEKAEKGKIDPLIGREKELERVIHILARRRKNNPLLVGDAGVGKTAIAEGLAWKIVQGEVPESLENVIVYALDMGALLAGTKFRGDFEARLKGVIQRLLDDEHSVLFIDEIHTVIGAGSTSGGTLDASNLLKPPLSNGELRCIGATTFKEFRNTFEKDHALARRFQKVDINEPSLEEAYQILDGIKVHFEKFHNVTYSTESIRNAVDLSAKYLHEKKLPDKAIDVMDEAGARVKLASDSPEPSPVTVADMEAMVAKMANIPPKTVSHSDKEMLRNLEDNLKLTLFGQEHAVAKVSTTLKLSRAGLGNQNKPIGSFLFAGPTGVGKTELSKELARLLGIEFIRFDMSEYMEKHTVARLIGAPPGYVGHEQGGQLTDAVNKTPHAVLLLDEIEKAHPDIYNVLLQLMDYGTVTDSNGRKTDFKNVILIMTSNAGARDLQKTQIGIQAETKFGSPLKEIERVFSPEFRNRLDSIILFNPLERESILKVVDKFIALLENQLQERNVTLHLEDAAREWLCDKGYDPKNGARPMEKLIQEKIAFALSEEILFGSLTDGGQVEIGLKNDELEFQFNPKVDRRMEKVKV